MLKNLFPKIIQFKELGDSRGNLVSIEYPNSIDFDIKRTYYLYNTKAGENRGYHGHKELKQVLIVVKGSCLVTTVTFGEIFEFVLDSPTQGLYIGHSWHVMSEFSDDCVLLVLASDAYKESDYLRSESQFLEFENGLK